ncbi:MAG: YchJ family protein [Ghiorsea sp.]
MTSHDQTACPCNSGKMLSECCEPYHTVKTAPTAEALMRSRYSAFVLGLSEYIWQTWHPDTRPELDILGGMNLKWISLDIVSKEAGLASDNQGRIRFVASYVANNKGKKLDENSTFVKEDGLWLYVDGDSSVSDISRNDACPCGSGKKFKRCCLVAK